MKMYHGYNNKDKNFFYKNMILAVRERWKSKPDKINKPIHRGDRMYCSSTIAELQDSESSFDSYLKIGSVGNKIKLEIPIKKHKQFNKWEEKGKRLNSYIITKDYVQFVFEIETGTKKEYGKILGIDTGIKCLATTNEGDRVGDKIEEIINKINRCKHGSIRQKKLRKIISDITLIRVLKRFLRTIQTYKRL